MGLVFDFGVEGFRFSRKSNVLFVGVFCSRITFDSRFKQKDDRLLCARFRSMDYVLLLGHTALIPVYCLFSMIMLMTDQIRPLQEKVESPGTRLNNLLGHGV